MLCELEACAGGESDHVARPLNHQLARSDMGTYATVTGVLLLVTVVAAVVPARRATRVNPIEVLKAE